MALRARISEIRAEHLLTEMLVSQGWDTRKPTTGDLLRQQEYRDHPHLVEVLQGRGKAGRGGDALPEGILVDRQTLEPLVVIEAKATAKQLDDAQADALSYGQAFVDAGYTVLTVALAGTTEDDFTLRVSKWTGSKWTFVTYDKDPITWVPNRADVDRLLPHSAPYDLRPSVPPVEVLHQRADEINRLLRESKIRDELRPGVVGAIMLALWQSKGDIRKDPKNILSDINRASKGAFWATKKVELQKSLHVDEANQTLAEKARRIVSILERLNVHVLTAEHDYLGQLYETFFRYTGGNTIGQYFTPRHMASFMADLVEVGSKDTVLDPACGTGGFLIAAMNRILVEKKLSRAQMVNLVRKKLIGIDSEPVTAAICVANMILRGDGSTGIARENCFTWEKYPIGKADVVLMNPPFPHKKTDTPSDRFVDRALEGLKQNGRLAAIVPMSTLVRRQTLDWRRDTLVRNTLEAVIGLPDELFEPHASSYTAVLFFRKGMPHRADRRVFFARITNDGLRMKKRVRVPIEGSQLDTVLRAYRDRETIPGLCGGSPISDIWGPGLYVPSKVLGPGQLIDSVTALIRDRAAFVVRHAPELVRMLASLSERDAPLLRKPPTKLGKPTPGTIGDYFSISYGQKSLHSKEHLVSGDALVISSSGIDNGCYGFFDFDDLLEPPFITVPSTGSYGEARVQEWPCGVTDDCLVLVPKAGVTREMMFIAAAVIRSERWRFNYGMKVTPSRIADYPVPTDAALVEQVGSYLADAKALEMQALSVADDALDIDIAHQRLREIDEHPEKGGHG